VIAGTYVEVSAERLVGLLQECGVGVERAGGTFAEERVGRERVFVLCAPGRPAIRVYSSLAAHAGAARGRGKDAVRVVIGVETPEGYRSVLRPRRVFRTAPRAAEDREGIFLKRLHGVLRDAWRAAMTVPRCPACGTMMAKRTAKKDDRAFWGCLNYPRCRETRRIE
jgi:hypothetical protein